MITNEESRIVKIVAVGKEGKVYPPCGRCREFIYQINNDNLNADTLVDDGKVDWLIHLLTNIILVKKLILPNKTICDADEV